MPTQAEIDAMYRGIYSDPYANGFTSQALVDQFYSSILPKGQGPATRTVKTIPVAGGSGKPASKSVREQRAEQLAEMKRQEARATAQPRTVLGGFAPMEAVPQASGTVNRNKDQSRLNPQGDLSQAESFAGQDRTATSRRPGGAPTPAVQSQDMQLMRSSMGKPGAPVPAEQSQDMRLMRSNMGSPLGGKRDEELGSYTVQAGDTLSSIAKRLTGKAANYRELAAINGIRNPNVIKAGQVIRLTGSAPRPSQPAVSAPRPSGSTVLTSGGGGGGGTSGMSPVRGENRYDPDTNSWVRK